MRRLDERGSVDEAHGRLADHVVDRRGEAPERPQGGVGHVAAFGRLLALYDNIVAALRWCLAHDDDGTRSLMLCAVLWGVVHQGHTDEIAALCEETIARWPDPTAPFAADAIATTATAMFLSGDPADALALAERSLDCDRVLDSTAAGDCCGGRWATPPGRWRTVHIIDAAVHRRRRRRSRRRG